MSADSVKSASITTLDSVGSTTYDPLTEGYGAPGIEHNRSDYVAATTGGLGSTSSLYKMVRLPTTCVLKDGWLLTKAALDSNASPTLAVDLGAYYSDATNDGTPASLQGTQISASCFISNQKFGGATTLKIDALSNLDANLRTSPLWKQVGLTADPGGYIDVVLAVHATAATAVAGNVGVNLSTVN
jgi:hypothetical protein